MDNREVEDIFNIEPQTDESNVPVYEPLVQEEVPTYEEIQPVEPVQEEVPTYEEVQPVEPVQEGVPTYEEVQPVEPVQEEVPTYEEVQPVEPVQEEVPTYEEVQPVEPVQEEVPTYEEAQPVEPVQEEVPTYEEVQPVEPVQEEVPTYEEVQPVQGTLTTSNINENPNAKISFGIKDDEEVNEYPRVPDWFKPRGYQIDAINSWTTNDFKGLLSMATGTGKTLKIGRAHV